MQSMTRGPAPALAIQVWGSPCSDDIMCASFSLSSCSTTAGFKPTGKMCEATVTQHRCTRLAARFGKNLFQKPFSTSEISTSLLIEKKKPSHEPSIKMPTTQSRILHDETQLHHKSWRSSSNPSVRGQMLGTHTKSMHTLFGRQRTSCDTVKHRTLHRKSLICNFSPRRAFLLSVQDSAHFFLRTCCTGYRQTPFLVAAVNPHGCQRARVSTTLFTAMSCPCSRERQLARASHSRRQQRTQHVTHGNTS